MCRVATLQLGTGEHQQGINASTVHQSKVMLNAGIPLTYYYYSMFNTTLYYSHSSSERHASHKHMIPSI